MTCLVRNILSANILVLEDEGYCFSSTGTNCVFESCIEAEQWWVELRGHASNQIMSLNPTISRKL